MIRKLLAWLLLAVALLWLLLSYAPPELIPWQISTGDGWLPLFRGLLVASALLFVVVQILLVAAIFKFPAQVKGQEADDSGEIQIHRSWEFLWTALPLVASIALFIVSYCALQP